MCCDNNEKSCICNTLKIIDEVQNNVCDDCCLDTCDRGFLGNISGFHLNTRPLVFYLSSGEMFSAFYQSNTEAVQTVVFRLESIKKCCAKLRCLMIVSNDPLVEPIFENIYNPAISLEATNNFVILDTDCCCGIQCLNDLYIKLC